jgi:hypothetical protein
MDETTMNDAYTDPVAKLLTYGEVGTFASAEPWSDYGELGFTEEHIAELIRMATDLDLHNSGSESAEIWAPLHAWRALAHLRAVEAARPLVLLFERLPHDDWVFEELPTVFAMIGPATIPTLEAFVGDDGVEEYCRITVPRCLDYIARDHPGERDTCVGVLVRQLEKFETNGDTLNAFLISGLIDLDATEAINLIRRAFSRDRVDLSVAGDIEEVEIEMGLRTHRSTPRPRFNLFDRYIESPGLADRDIDDPSFGYPPPRRVAKVGRNDPCPCGSGKKYKKCCLD